MRPPRKIVVLLGVLVAVAMWIIEDEGTIVSPSPNEPSLTAHNFGDATSASGSSIRPQLPAREPLPRTERDPLSARSWATPSPSAFVSAPPQVPVAPPLPYRFVGEIVLPTETWAFLARGDAVFQVREGGTIGGEYKVESVKADELVLLHLASGVRQTARSASPGGENPGTGPQTVQAAVDSVAPASGTDARSVSSVNDSTSPSEEPAPRVRRPHRIRRPVESTD